jgi:hypothetical protein
MGTGTRSVNFSGKSKQRSVVVSGLNSLDDFAGSALSVNSHDGCAACNLPIDVLRVIHENEDRPKHLRHTRRTVAKWVTAETGVKVSHDTLYRHLHH